MTAQPHAMPRLRPLGSTGLLVSPIGLGLVKLGRNSGVKYPGGGGYALPTDEQAVVLLRAAAELGVNLLDTAPAYGTSEERLGELMARADWLGGRDRWVVCTKAGEEFDAATATSRYDFSPSAIRASVERSLRRLRIDVLDVVLLHSDGRDEWVLCESGALETLRDLKQEGKVRAVGISPKSPAGTLLAVERGCDVVMVTLNPDYLLDKPAIDAARARGLGIVVKKALASGFAADPRAAIRFVTGTPGVASAVVGTLNPDNLRSNVRAVDA
jgi:aryl-alcohol dehydrogenase-like predicted oxidoreductase